MTSQKPSTSLSESTPDFVNERLVPLPRVVEERLKAMDPETSSLVASVVAAAVALILKLLQTKQGQDR